MSPGLGCTRLGWPNIAVVASLIILHKPDIALCPASPIATDDTSAQCTYSHMQVIDSITGAPALLISVYLDIWYNALDIWSNAQDIYCNALDIWCNAPDTCRHL